ncbi:MAG: PAS domain S-box protein [Candidatus Thorarchaeota archaeon]
MSKEILSSEELECKLRKTEHELEKVSMEKEALERAIWDMLNHSKVYVLLLDSKMNVLLMNNNFAVKLGFKSEKEVIGKCWLDFIKPEEKDQISNIHQSLAFTDKDESHKYREVVNDVIRLDGKVCTIKWFNFSVNHEYNLTFSIGIPKDPPSKITEESIRTYYQDMLEKDKTMISSLRDTVLREAKTNVNLCENVRI